LIFPLIFAFYAQAQDQFLCTTNNGALTIKRYVSEFGVRQYGRRSEVLSIPKSIGGLPVVSIGDNAFYNHNELVSVTIPEGLTSIGSGAFQSCGLTNIVISESVTNIGLARLRGAR